jgi:pantoate--beta-alanine ligase
MVLLHSLESLLEWQKNAGWNYVASGFVPTMGALHEGHASLIRQAKSRCKLVVVSVLVNPTQFNDAKDFAAYPRSLDGDAAKAKEAGADALFAPTAEDLYGGKPSAKPVHWGPLTHAYEGAHRPGHFDGVVAVVDLLFQVVRPDVAVFGEKDLQQVAVVKRLAEESHPSIQVVVGELIRDASGLALSSRNARLSSEGIDQALALSRALRALQAAAHGEEDWDEVLAREREALANSPGVTLEYLDAVDAASFEPAAPGGAAAVHAVVAAHVEGVRLIDNAPLRT